MTADRHVLAAARTIRRPPPGQFHVEQVMGTAVSFDVRDDLDAAALNEAIEWLHDVDSLFSTYSDASMITRFARGELRVEALDPLVHEVLDLCALIEFETDGAFDIHVPAPNGTSLEPSGLVKGWSIERAAEILERHGAQNFMINGGGDIAVRGHLAEGQKWRVGVRHPEVAHKFAAVLDVAGPLAIATSALYERGPHIIDPRSGRPAEGLLSATVLGPDLTYADAYATALFVMGLDGMTWLMQDHPGYGALVVTDERRTYSTPLFDHYRTVQVDQDESEAAPARRCT